MRIIYFASRSNRSSFFGVVFLCLLFFLIAHDAVHIGLDGQKLLHLITGLSVAGLGCLFLCHQLRIFRLQTLDGGELFHSQLIK